MVTSALTDVEAVELIHAGAKDYVLKDRLARLAPAVRLTLLAEQEVHARKVVDQELRIAATAFETQEGIVITDRDQHILRVNCAFTRLTGYSAMEALGRTPAILKSGRQDAAFYQAMWETLNRDKYWQGELWNRRKNGEIYPEWLTITAVLDGDGQVTNYVGVFSDITLRKEADEKIHQLAFYDPLTGLPNRRLLHDRLQQAMTSSVRSQCKGALLFLDLDNFKVLNDTRGHDIGDLLLIEVAKCLRDCVRSGDTVARIGGDEFIIMLENLSEDTQQAAAAAQDVGEKVLKAINHSFSLQGVDYHCSSSIGINLFHGNDTGMDDLLRHADTAMYQAKASGRNTLRFFDPAMQIELEERTALMEDLRQALPLQQLRLYHQIQVNERGVVGSEVLLRWQHPVRGLISPMEFIPLAEETGLIVPIGAWVLHMACVQLKAWQVDPLTRHLRIAVNVSARQFSQPNFVEQVLEVLKDTGVNPLKLGLELELTESLVLNDIDDSIGKMQALRSIGIRFSLDDFGTGQSSLSYLKRLPLDQIKIDQSFVRDIATDPNDAAIVRTIIGMAENLGLKVIAEGVETEQQREFLERNGCHAHQGYLFGKPVPIDEFQNSLTQLHR
ncbi:MAG: EAL domain-containing protein [Ferrovum myxofaciens]|nr:EAL domain-containing protein [Ferrovum myxofaciens]